ncbi:MAG: NAD(P)/FAD-dependent oxidoreductase [Acidobacteriota bacterium]
MKTFDVVVIGAGLAGLQCSRLLARQGFRILLVDRKPTVAHSVHTTGIFVRRTLEDFDLPEDCLGPPVRHVRLYSPARRSMDLASPHDEFRVGRMGMLYQRFLNQCRDAGVKWLPETRFTGVMDSQTSSVVYLESQGVTHLVRTHLIVGADGANSRVARALGLDQNQEWIVGIEEVLEDVPLNGPPRFHCFLDPRLSPGYLAWAVHDGEQVHVGVGGYSARFDPQEALEEFRCSLNDIIDLRHARFVEKRGGRIPVGGVMRRIANERGLLVGDAAGAVSPLTAGGLDPCMRLSTFAANEITKYLLTDGHRSLANYSGGQFRARFISRLWLRRVLKTINQPALVELACGVMRLPLLRSFAWHVFFGRNSFPDIDSRSRRHPPPNWPHRNRRPASTPEH